MEFPRKSFWKAVAKDDADALHQTLSRYKDDEVEILKDISMLAWKHQKGKGSTETKPGKPYGLVRITAGMKKKIPEMGAIQCLKYCLTLKPGEVEVKKALRDAEKLNRSECVSMLQRYLDVDTEEIKKDQVLDSDPQYSKPTIKDLIAFYENGATGLVY